MADTEKKLLDAAGVARLWGKVKELIELVKNSLKTAKTNTAGLLRIGDKDNKEDVANWDESGLLYFQPGLKTDKLTVKTADWKNTYDVDMSLLAEDWRMVGTTDMITEGFKSRPLFYYTMLIISDHEKISDLNPYTLELLHRNYTYNLKGGNTYELIFETINSVKNRKKMIMNIMISSGKKTCVIMKCYQDGQDYLNTVVVGDTDLIELDRYTDSDSCGFRLAEGVSSAMMIYPDDLDLRINGKYI